LHFEFYPLLVLRRDADFQFFGSVAHCFLAPPLANKIKPFLISDIVPQIRFSKNGRTQEADSHVRHIFRVSVTVSGGDIF
ncbi:hypothetical protein, partial [uncultured Acetatifactor sp.]|uniref:hypothetical protein n=1 Tax=uncultured Acetatifactor sp. TaxID=1671927 RepID=UPI0026185A96